MNKIAGVILSCLLASGASAAADPVATGCEALTNERERLQCYDAAAGRTATTPDAEPFGHFLDDLQIQPANGSTSATALSRRWELDPETKQGLWLVRPYQPMFLLLARYSDRTNDLPQSPTHPVSVAAPLYNTEAEFQMSFKFKVAENLLRDRADLWLAYTQQNQWQVYSPNISRPFRETNYQPEIFLVFPTNYNLFGLTGRFVQLGLVHQSNGRAQPLSRSWNRAYVNFGFERGNFALMVRPWYRFPEHIEDDDNPDIQRYLGYGDVTAIYTWGRQVFTLLGRYNTSTSYGTAQGTWNFPIHNRLRGYVKVFSGYGETLIDYNWYQTTIGAGIVLADWL